MSRSCYYHWQTALHCDSTIKIKDLQSNLPLIMVHGDDAVVSPSTAFNKYGVGRKWTFDIDSSGLSGFHSRNDLVDLFAPQKAIFAAVWIECTYTEAWLFCTKVRAVSAISALSGHVCEKGKRPHRLTHRSVCRSSIALRTADLVTLAETSLIPTWLVTLAVQSPGRMLISLVVPS